MTIRWSALVVVGLAVAACGGGDGRGGTDGGGTGSDAGGGADGGGGVDGGDVDAGEVPGACNTLCGSVASPAAGAGVASFAPPGCDSSGTFQRAWFYEMTGIDAAKNVPFVADVTGDGVPDLVTNPRKMPSAVVFEGQADGTFAASPTTLPSAGLFAGGWGVDLGDLDGDGRPDLVAGDHTAGAVAWLNTSGGWTVVSGGLPSGTYSGAGVGDIDGDGALDAIFGADQLNAGYDVALGDGSGGFTATSLGGLPSYGSSSEKNLGYFAFHDLDGDEDLDLFAFGQDSGSVSAFVYQNEGGTSFTRLGAYGRGGAGGVGNPVQGAVGDVSCDGEVDIAAGGSVYLGSGGSWSLGAMVDGADIAHLGDLDGDGDLDLVTQSSAGVAAYLNDGTGLGWTETPLGLPDATYAPPGLEGTDGVTPVGSPFGIDLADVDGDGDLDLVRSYKATSPGSFGTNDHNYLELWLRQ